MCYIYDVVDKVYTIYVHLVILRYHSTKRYSSMLVDMVKYSFKHFTTNIVKVNINTIRKIPVKF
jgi:hypothetical protein